MDIEGEAWTLKLVATSIKSQASPENNIEYQFTTSFVDGCTIDELSSDTTITSFVYYLDDTGLKVIEAPIFTQTVPTCKTEWTILAVD